MRARGLLAAYAVLAVVNVLGQVAGSDWSERLTKPLLVPLLVAHLLLNARDAGARLVGVTAAALFFCWLGDLALMVESWFLVGLAMFLAGQVGYCVAFATAWERNPIRASRPLAAPYAAWLVLLVVLLGPDLGGLVAPVGVYGAVLCTMAALALGVHRLAAIGAIAFVASDSLLAATALSDRFAFAGDDALVMATYTVGQLLIVLGVLAAERTPAPAPVRTASTGAGGAGW